MNHTYHPGTGQMKKKKPVCSTVVASPFVSKQASNLQKERKGFVLDPTDIQSFFLQKTE